MVDLFRRQWERYFGGIELPKESKGKRVKKVDFRLVADDFSGQLHVTDMQLQEGQKTSGYVSANKEMLKREVGHEGNTIRYRHFNGVMRGKRKIAVPNRAQVRYEDDFQDRVTGGMDLTLTATQDIPGNGLHYSYLFGTRPFALHDNLREGDVFRLIASEREVSINGKPTGNYKGTYQTVPRSFGRYNVNVKGSSYLLAEVDTWLLGTGGERM